MIIPLSEADIQRFWSKVNKLPDECWVWTDVLASTGYGQLGIGGRQGKKHSAHVISYQLAYGEVPKGLQVDHLCRNRACVNPKHLEAVTQRINLLRGVGISAKNAVKTHCIRGHEFTPANTHINKKTGRRQCKICQLAWKRHNRTPHLNPPLTHGHP